MTDSASPDPAIARLDEAGAHCLPTPVREPDPAAHANQPFGFPLGPVPVASEPETAIDTDPGPVFSHDSGPFFLSVLNGSTDCIKILRCDGTLEFMNANGLCLMEIDDFAPMKGKSWAALWPEESRYLLTDAIENARQGHHSRFEALCPTAKGTPKYWDVSVSPVNGPAGAEWFVSISRDITAHVLGVHSLDAALQEQKRLSEALERHRETLEERIGEALAALRASEAEQREMAAALAQSQKMDAVGKLTGGVAHDFNNVLQVIGGNLQLAAQEAGGNETVARRLACAHEAVERGAKLASQLLAFARRQPLEPVALDVSRLLRSFEDMLRRVLGETIELETVVSGGLWNTLADPNHLQNVIVNLAINARDSMDGAGRLTIEAGNAMLDDDYTRHHDDLSSGQYVMIAVSDTGCGMAPEVLARVFEPFYTTKAEGRGTGLGLSMAYGFMKQTGGHIKLYSEPGHGTTVKLYLPRSLEDEAVRVEAANDPVTGGTETILVVEDDPNVRTTVVDMLTQLGYQVLKAADAQSALSVLESGVHIDLLFSDVVMPGPMRSVDLARRAKDMLPGLEVLFTSGYTENAIVHGGRLDQGVALISKPYRRDALARKVRWMFRSRIYETPGVPDTLVEPQPLRVLIVEDDANTREATRELLELLDARVLAVDSAQAALDLIAQQLFDVLLTDVRMPGMSGLDLARAVKRMQPRVHVVLASGYGAGIATELGDELSGVTLLPKPFNFDELEQAVFKKP
ncbi:response regulator [Caballeronia sp. SEWSISQ10-4 2]|uniref:hybrid sensor histidine kinase/response regulator n=1 Tax=Caballeronia sp. SEWSISQ10-4 2 TaxID=2937438 RepID=UPI0026529F4F|nr:response regulator [Caballeronia sp. SEWSISQ10-4 2]MDN7183738.1 response regulator [Caballeronia sp. SEWSISQ10-4 2]